ncbi:glycosyltransferase family 2 protein [Candidatus Berkelbacteria bacterium]|nr:glycosyltransferase family 2 protein [Candidatus Berkelbacteria bacterium]
MKQLSLVLPIYNHADSLERIITKTKQVLKDAGIDYEIILVENGSTDNSYRVCQALTRKDRNIITFKTKPGYGRAIIAGLARARGSIVGYSEANGLIYPNVIPYLVWLIEDDHCDLAKGLRVQRETRYRAIQSRIYNFLVNLLFGLGLDDTNTCPKLFRRELIKTFKLESQRSVIDLEIPLKARALGLRIFEIPIPYLPRLSGKSLTSIKTVWQFVSEMLAWRVYKLSRWQRSMQKSSK